MKREQVIVNKLLGIVGLYQKIFGKDTEYFLYKRDREEDKMVLKNVFGYRDVEELFPKQIDEKRVEKMSNIFFTYAGQDEKKGLLSKNNE